MLFYDPSLLLVLPVADAIKHWVLSIICKEGIRLTRELVGQASGVKAGGGQSRDFWFIWDLYQEFFKNFFKLFNANPNKILCQNIGNLSLLRFLL